MEDCGPVVESYMQNSIGRGRRICRPTTCWFRRTIAGQKQGLRLKGADANKTQRVRADSFVRLMSICVSDPPPAFFNEEFFKVLYNLSELNNFTANEIRNYMRSLYAESDYANTIEYAEKVGEERGIEIGTAKRSTEIAAAMLVKGLPIELICELTGLTPEEIDALRKQ